MLAVSPILLAIIFVTATKIFSWGSIAALVQGIPAPLLSVNPSPAFSGQAHQGNVILATFNVGNVTRDPVRLLGAESSCGCTVVLNDFPMELSPGATQRIEARVKVGQPGDNGKFIKTVQLLVNRGGNVPPLTIAVTVLKSPNVSTENVP